MSTSPEATPAAAPKVDPESVALRASPRPVTRLNRRMLAVGAGALAAAVLGGTLWSLQSNKRPRNPAAELYNVDRVSRAENLDQLPKDYAGIRPALKQAPPVLGEPLPGDLGPAIVKAQQPMEMRPPGGSVDPAQAERLAAEEAARSSVFFRSGAGGGGPKPGAAQVAVDPSALAPGNQPFNPMGTVAVAAQPADPTAAQNRQDQKEAFVAKAGDTSTRNAGSLQLPASPYQVMAGTIIPAALVTGINSDLPGQVIANVSEAVYDTATGRHLLIPQGSRLIG
ncbi:MAG TPA: TrbI/VirB10 family protein, partial [Solimonas sp.]|nr:TrbI/VirB10 family protein [Solimonas sp.]